MENIIAALITGAVTLVGVLIANSKSQAVMDVKLDELTRKVTKHNEVIERTYRLEEAGAVLEEKMKVANHRLDDLEQALK